MFLFSARSIQVDLALLRLYHRIHADTPRDRSLSRRSRSVARNNTARMCWSASCQCRIARPVRCGSEEIAAKDLRGRQLIRGLARQEFVDFRVVFRRDGDDDELAS